MPISRCWRPFGHARVTVYRRPTVAIVATGDEIVEIDEIPEEFQIRNSNAYSLAAQVARAGGVPRMLPVARDTVEHTREMIGRGLEADLLLLSGGVSAGKYDVVEQVLAEFGAEFYFDRVLIQPGQPLVFGRAARKILLRTAGKSLLDHGDLRDFRARRAGTARPGRRRLPLHMPLARLTRDFRHRAGLTRFLPARLSADGSEVTPVDWHGSGDIPALTRANAYLVADPDRAEYAARRTHTGTSRNEKTLALRFRRQPRAWWMSPPSRRRAALRARTPSCASRPTCSRNCRENPKGNPLEIARIAGIAAAKRTSELIPLCHPLMLTHADVEVTLEKKGVRIVASAATTGQTGVEMEALTAAGGGRPHGVRHDQSAR